MEADVGELLGAVGRVLAELGEALASIAAVGLAGIAESGAPTDRQGLPLAPVIAWHDPRGAETVAKLEERFGAALARRIGQPLRAVSSVAKLGWLLDHGVTSVARWLGVPELCLHALTGAQVTEHSLAARTGAYDVVGRGYIAEVAAALSLPAEVFPPVVAAGTLMGAVSASGASWSGLPAGIPAVWSARP